MIACKRHQHKTLEGAKRCRQDWVDKNILKPALMEPCSYELEIHKPPIKIKRGPFDVVLFSEGFKKTRGWRNR